MSELPASARYLVVGAGVHGLSTAWQLARAGARDVLVLDKTGVGAGASGIACGIVRNNYAQPAMRGLMAHSVSVWESDPGAFHYHGVGYLHAAPESMRAGLAQVHAEQVEIGYPSTFVEGEQACRRYLDGLFDDWQAPGISAVLHEHRGGFAHNRASMDGLATKAEQAGARILTGVRVTGLDLDDDGAVRAVRTDRGTIGCDHLIVAVGPWVRELWAMLGLPAEVDVAGRAMPMWTYLLLQEGTLGVDPAGFTDTAGNPPPVMHVDSDQPLYDERGELVTDELWGIYYKPDAHFGGIQGGSVPVAVGNGEVAVDPYGPASKAYQVGDDFAREWTAALAHCHRRFEGLADRYRREPSGGLGCFTPDSFPVFDRFRNAYLIADSNHGYKLLGVGELVARELLGEPQPLLEPFRFSRFATGALHPTSSSPFPWS